MTTETPHESAAQDTAAPPNPWLKIESMDLDGQGVAHREDGKVVFVEGALPFEEVRANVHRKKNNWEQGSVVAIRRESSQRVPPRCPHFGLHPGACGGCKMQHLDATAQVAVKQRALEDNLWHLGKVRAERVLRPMEGPGWHYRYRARLSVRYVHKKGTTLIGFHERKSSYVADMSVCPVLPARMSAMLHPLRALINTMDTREQCPQIEMACADAPGSSALGVIALVLRHLAPLGEADLQRLRDFAREHEGVQWWLQPKGPDTAHRLDEAGTGELAYELPEFDVRMPFKPTDFTQVNPQINRVLVSRALRLLDAQPDERVIDWFCGLGNFTLPLATQAGEVLGIEGSEVLVQRAQQNLDANRAASAQRRWAPTRFVARNLFEMTPQMLVADGMAQCWLVDPPREGAFALVKALADLHQQPELRPAGWTPPRRIVYVSCNPSTLARDAGLLVHQGGYRCTLAGMINMFPHTAHVESMAVFDLDTEPRKPPEAPEPQP